MAGIYLHIPFCFKKCDYCDFYKTTNISLKSDFLNTLKKEIDKNRNFIDSEIIETVYFGGGTPSVLKVEEVRNILDSIFTDEEKLNRADEITFELNPDDGSPEYLKLLKKTGVNRLSIGIQSFDDSLLKLLNRRHNIAQAKSVVKNARTAGFENISIDLMYGLPAMSIETWIQTIDEAIEMQVEHISAYHLTYEKGTVFNKKLEKGVFKEIPEDESVEQFKILIEKLKKAGYEHYEISNFSLPGKNSKHNSNYWNGSKYIGFGPSAHSFDGTKRYWNVSDINRYLKGEFIDKEEVLSDTDRYNEMVMLRLRTLEGITEENLNRIAERYHNYFLSSVKKHITSGNISVENRRYFISPKGIFISDYIISELFFYD